MPNSSCGAFNINIQHKKDSKNAVADLLSLCHFSESYEPGIHSYGKCPWLYFCLFCVLLVCLCRWCGMSVFCLHPFQVQPTAISLSCIHFIILRTLTRRAPASLPPRAKEWLDGHFQMCIYICLHPHADCLCFVLCEFPRCSFLLCLTFCLLNTIVLCLIGLGCLFVRIL